MEILMPIWSSVFLGVIIVNLGRMVIHARTETRLFETFLENQFKQENAFTRIWGLGTNDGSPIPAPTLQEESRSNMTTVQTLNL